jgi:LmbE family N-acetylglucosaminyl deacetylase
MAKRILAVSAHIGDEIMGCGGTLLRHVRGGDAVRVVVLGEGWTSRTRSLQKGLEAIDLEAFEHQARAALGVLSIADVRFHRLPDNRFDQMPLLEIVKIVEEHKAQFRPDVVYTNTAADLGVDQRTTCGAVATAFRPQPGEPMSALLAFEVRSSTELLRRRRDHPGGEARGIADIAHRNAAVAALAFDRSRHAPRAEPRRIRRPRGGGSLRSAAQHKEGSLKWRNVFSSSRRIPTTRFSGSAARSRGMLRRERESTF